MQKYLNILLVAVSLSGSILAQVNNSKPWTYWWWMGSAVDKEGITYNLEEFASAGIGGVHIIPIYGVKGYDDKFIDFLSPKWMEMLDYTSAECKRLGMGLDMTAGTGWPFGGPWVSVENSSMQMLNYKDTLKAGEAINTNLKSAVKGKTEEGSKLSVVSVNAFYGGRRIDITSQVDTAGNIFWKSPANNCIIIAVVSASGIQMVKRAAPGGKGFVVDPFSAGSVKDYLSVFDEAFKTYKGNMPEAFYHDSYEYYGADWTPDFFEIFEKQHGYKLQDMLPEFFSSDSSDIISRTRADYRSTIAELHEVYVKTVADWAHQHGVLFRDQAHGSPTNLLDTYAAADIPETEVFGSPAVEYPVFADDTNFVRKEYVDPLIIKFASSAAHVSGKNLVSSETGTWLTEHFRETLARVKPEVDLLFLSGINHVFYHGIAYSPKGEEWPGWQFYAASNFGPTNSLWQDIPAMNKYIENCQSVLSEGVPDNDVVLYYPVWDTWHSSENGLIKCEMHNPEKWLFGSEFYKAAKILYSSGFSFDYISDKQLSTIQVKAGNILSSGSSYKTIIIPACRFIPAATLEKLKQIINNGGRVIFTGKIPTDVPGYYNYRERQNELKELSKEILTSNNCIISPVDSAGIVNTMIKTGIKSEELKRYNLDYIRRKTQKGTNYFVVNMHPDSFTGWISLSRKAQTVVITDPLTGKKGKAEIRNNSKGTIDVYIQVEQGKSLILTLTDKPFNDDLWVYLEEKKSAVQVKGTWDIEFIKGCPVLPSAEETDTLKSWTLFNDKEAKRFAGTARYSIKFSNPDSLVKYWYIDLGKVCESARVKLNGKYLGTLWSYPYSIAADNLQSENTLEIEVTNMPANRIKDMDEREVNWKKFYDINIVNIKYKKFDASKWQLADSGLLGPVKLYPAEQIEIQNNDVN